ncbi:MAG: hypothetical protein QM737_16735 [Ferruginibacter sp.]
MNSKNRFSKKLLLLLLIIGITVSTRAQVQVTSTGGVVVPTNYLTLKAAFDAINAGTHTDVITISITGSPVEGATAVLNSSGAPSSYTSISITPSGPGKLVSGNLATGLVKLNGADNVTIDGGASNDLTFSNSSTSASSGVIWVASASLSDGASNNTIKNCIITGGGATTMGAAISQSSGVTFGGLAETANSNNSYLNNTVTAALYGFKMAGATSNEDQNTIISGNTVNTNGHAGIYAQMQNNVLISKNTISAVSTTSGGLTFQTSGIIVVGSIIGGLIDKNKIYNVRVNGVWGCNGIQLDATNTNTGLTISNNFIYDIASGGFSGYDTVDDNATGIAVNKGGGYKIHYNSIDMGTNFTGTSTTYKSSALWISGTIAANSLTITNNILSNRITVANRFSIYSNSANTIFSSINSNDYYTSGSVGFLGSIQSTLANWQVASLQDDASVSVNPFFTNATDLHLLGNSPLDALAVPVAGITLDIDGAARNATTPDIGADEFTPPNCTNPVIDGFPATASITEICASGSATLSASGYSYGVGIAYLWEYSTVGTSGPWISLGQTNPLTATTGTINATRYYHLKVTCNGLTAGYSVPITIVVNNPAVTGGPNVSRCGIGTVDLTATGSNLQWYAASTGGSVLGTGSPFTTPLVTSTTSFWVSAATAGISGTGGKPAPVGTTGYNGLTGLIFDATQPFTLLSVRVYPMAAGQVTIQAVNSSGALIPGCTHTENFPSVSPTGYQVDLFFPIPIGTNHRLVLSNNASNISIRRDFNPGNNFPYILTGVGSITSGYISGVSTTYYYFFDWRFTTRCESLRAEVKAIVNDPPALTTVSPAAGAPRTICTGSSVTLDATGGGYTSYVWNPGALPNGSVVSPTTTTTYTLSATTPDPGGCRRDSTVTITVNQTPTPLTITPANVSICPNLAYQVTTSGGLISGQTIFSEMAEVFPLTQFTIGGSGVTLNQNTTYYQQPTKSIHLTYANSANGFIQTGNIPLTGFTAPSLTFYHICGTEASATSHWDVGYVEYSTDGGTVWTKFPVATYGGSGTLHQQINDATPAGVGFDNTSYPDWDGQFTGSASTPGVGPAASLWKQETINLSTWQNQPNFRIRFRLLADGIITYYGWLIDNITIKGTGQAPVTWNNTANLWATNAHTTPPAVLPNVGNWPAPWYWVAANTGAVTYTATATGGVGCTTSASVTISATSAAPAISIAAVPSGPICAGTPVTFTATPINGGVGAAYNWKKNTVSLFGSQVGLTSITLTNLVAGDNITCDMSVVPNVCFPGGTIVFSNTIGPYTVNPLPVANNINGSTGSTVCTGTPNVLTETAVGTISTYQWFEGTNPVGTNSSTYSAAVPGSYSVIISTAAGCKDTSAAFVVTLPTNTITATAGPNGTIDPIGAVIVGCGNDTIFNIIPNPGYSILDVTVNGVSVGPVTSYTFNNVTGDSTIHATFFLAGCASPHTSFAGPNASMCSGPNFTLSGTRSIGGGAASGTWSTSGDGTFIPNSTFAGATSYTPGPNDINAGTVNLTLTTNTPTLPCLPSASTMTLTIKRSPSVTMGGLIGFCAVGATTTYLVADTSATAQNITGIQWYNPALIPGATNDSLFVSSTGTYSVTVTGSNGCTAGAVGNVNVFAPPTVIIAGTGPICTNAGVDLNATTTPGSGTEDPNGYEWYLNGVLIPGSITSVLTATQPGDYKAKAKNSNGCISTAFSNTITLSADNSPLNGDYTIGLGPASCTNYISFASAINDLNNRSISGNVRFSVQGGYTETVSSPGLILGKPTLNAATASGFTISFFKSTAGANPLLTAFTGGTGTPATAIPDGIFKLRGVDNVSILEIDLAENAANSGNSLMDFGYGLFRYSATDGAQNNTIQGCTITLNKANSTATAVVAGLNMSEGATGILVVNSVDSNAIAPINPTSVAGTNSYNKFYGNTITNCHNGIWLGGYNALTPFTLGDTGNDIGGISSGTGNIITNFGNTADATAPNGIRIINQWGVNAQFNTIDNNDGAGVNTTNSLNGIVGVGGTSANATISNNTISLKSSATGGQSVFGIDNGIGSTAASNTITINGNIITGASLLATNAQWIGIRNTATAATVTISGNTVQNVTLAGNGASSIFYGINNSVTVPVINVNNNIISGNTKLATGTMYGISLSTPTLANIISNIVSNNTINGGAAVCTMNCIISAGTGTYTLDGNTIYNNSITNMTLTNIGTVYGYSNIGSPTAEILTDNIVRKLFVTGAAGSTAVHVIRGIYNNTTGATARTCSRNQVDSLYTNAAASGAIVGIYSQAGGAVVMGNNKIHSLFPGQQGTSAAFAKGILIAGGTTSVKCYNNAISLDFSQAFAPAANSVLNNANAVAGIELNAAPAVTYSIYYNTIRLAGGAGATTFGSSGISLVSTTGTADLRDNLVVNVMVPLASPTGFITALRRPVAVFTGYGTTSNNNLWYTTQTTATPLYYNGAAGFNTLALFKTNVTPRETFSIDDNPVFVSTALNNLHLDPANNCNIDGAGTPIAGYSTDYDFATRNATLPDIGMDEFNGTGTGFTWKGYNTDWMNASNWCGGVPTAVDNVIIPGGKNFYPNIVTTNPVAHNITINTGGSITIASGGILSNTGSWTNDGSLTNNGTIVLNGNVNQSFPGGGAGTIPVMNNLTVNNAGGVTINKDLTLIGNLEPNLGNIAVNDTITLHSDASGTASVDTVLGSFTYNAPGKFVVERFITTNNIGPAFGVGWRYLAAPITGTQTINEAWQEGQTPGVYTGTGYGTQIVGPGGTAVGFDQATALPSLKKYDPVTNTYVGVPGTLSPNFISATDGYMIFIRGDRAANTLGSHNATTLRMAGPIKTGNVTLSTPTVNQFIPVGNPYPCAISFTSMAKTNLQDFYYIWDPKISTYGAWQTFSGPSYAPSIAGGSYGPTQSNIESGMAFMVKANAIAGTHSLQINESCKRIGSFSVARVNGPEKQLRTRLIGAANNPMIYDGNKVDFDPAWSNAVDDNDAEKMTNFGENFGIIRDGKGIVIERRAEIVNTDTIFFNMAQMKVQDYQLEFTAENLASPVLTAYLEDAFLNSRTQINLDAVTTVNFTVTADPLSKAANRFRIVFKQQGVVPLSFISIKAFRQDHNIMVNWTVANEANIAHYEILHSADGRNFSQLGTQAARNINGIGSQQYGLLDVQPYSGDNFYRIKSINNSGEIKYSDIVKVNMKGDPSMITLYPNPVKDRIIRLEFSNQPKGDYEVKLYGINSQLILKQHLDHPGGNEKLIIPVSESVAKGIYTLEVVLPKGKKQVFKLVIE